MTARSTHITVETLKTRRLFRHPFYERLGQSARLLLAETLKRNPLELKDTRNSTYKAFRVYVFASSRRTRRHLLAKKHDTRSSESQEPRNTRKKKERKKDETFQSAARFNKKFPPAAWKIKMGESFKFSKQLKFFEIFHVQARKQNFNCVIHFKIVKCSTFL